MSDQEITCSDCGGVFAFREAEQQFYLERGLASPPKRCKSCRQARKTSQGGAAAGRDGGPRPGFGGGRPSFDGPPRGRGPREARPWNGNGGAPRPSGDGGPPRRFDRGANGHGGNGFTGSAPGGPRRFDGRPPRSDVPGGERPRAQWGSRPNGDAGANHAAPHEPAGEKPARKRPERPKYDITCAECGTTAQVPFKPLEGRQVFCQPCYRARQSVASPAEPVAHEEDTGIVE